MTTFRLRPLLPMILLGLTVSLLLFLATLQLEQRSNEAHFRELADQRINAVRINVAAALNTVAILAGHFEITPKDGTSRNEFNHLVTPVIARHPFIQALEWIPRIKQDERQTYEKLAQADGLENFHFTERNADGVLIPATDRPEYFPVFYVQPVSGNVKAQGYDLASDKVRRAALETARQTRTLTATARVNLVQEQGNQYGTLVFAPVFTPSRHDLVGYVLGVFRIGDFVTKAWTSNQIDISSQMIDIHMFDLGAPADSQLLFPKDSTLSLAELTAGLHLSNTFDMAGRRWMMVATPGPAFKATPIYSAGIFMVSLVALIFYLFYLRSNMHRAEAAATFARHVEISKQRLAEAQRIARVGYIEFDEDSGTWSTSDECVELLKLDGAICSSEIGNFLVNADPVDRETLKSKLDTVGSANVDMELHVDDLILHVLGNSGFDGVQPRNGLLILQDVTRQRAAAIERENMIQRIAEVNRMEALGTLAGGIAHEINTPTQYVSDNVAFIKDGITDLLDFANTAKTTTDAQTLTDKLKAMDFAYLETELPSAAAQALEGTERIAKIVQAVKEFSYPSSKTPHPIDMNRTINMVSVVTRNQWKYVAEMEFDLAPDLPQVIGIEGEINQVLVNLIVNAAYAIGEKKADTLGRIVLKTKSMGDHAEISISDTGIGIPAENTKKIFEMFFTTKPPGQGTGQGLAITKAIIRRHNGTISVRSTVGEGTCFTFTLPFSTDETVPVLMS